MTTLPSHRTKINRAMRLAKVGENRATAEALLRVLPESVIARVTGQELAELLDAVWKLSRNSRASTETELVSDGGVWDEDKQAFRELA
ncbi:hypothetical protein O4G76_07160 [Limimaricola sp. G21655-S1]|uniref:hypothetical protein n=1 Tax=Limimaricola sp. G21655-S1 TaxID=3014768 RepID=UPI0022AFBD1E|nr:hypothetical protein [Limimaricola sp. G21655-S1]MCZ4260619.1 hypothetical protein [Limimaricola sp. G21655-S1]